MSVPLTLVPAAAARALVRRHAYRGSRAATLCGRLGRGEAATPVRRRREPRMNSVRLPGERPRAEPARRPGRSARSDVESLVRRVLYVA
ncbi:hypothetical protein OG893_16610 [Streptomyces sp. NBC_01696]|uniref:hypothetical protein n=1 Tax=unclassified Streptomyces TaxID=2593676 RepID=UPI000F55082E|nr:MULTISPECIES: hypothetical protein [unclassified Streptomyces]